MVRHCFEAAPAPGVAPLTNCGCGEAQALTRASGPRNARDDREVTVRVTCLLLQCNNGTGYHRIAQCAVSAGGWQVGRLDADRPPPR